jgi:hypothetical protein
MSGSLSRGNSLAQLLADRREQIQRDAGLGNRQQVVVGTIHILQLQRSKPRLDRSRIVQAVNQCVIVHGFS